MLPPPLEWVQAFCVSTGAALGQPMVFDVKATVNPLVYTVTASWQESVAGSIALQVWNLFQMWLTTNDCVQNGSVQTSPTSITVQVVVKRRMGNPKNESP